MRVDIAVPCFDEEQRLDESGLRALLDDPDVHLVLVDDGSRDRTLEWLRAFEARMRAEGRGPARVRVISLGKNLGKAEAVRAGMRSGIDAGADVVGYLDADLATPAGEMLRIVDALRRDQQLIAVMGTRLARLGAHIERSAVRHYLGRVFATAASEFLGVAVYDTQCGAKAFRVDAALRDALSQPFASGWVFDVELLDRLLSPAGAARGDRAARAERILELPLDEWRDVRGSKVTPLDALHAAVDLARLAARRRRR